MYLNLRQLAESFGVSEKVVEDWVRNDALPHVPDRGRRLFDRVRVAHWADAHGLTAKAGFLAPEPQGRATGFALVPLLRRGGIWRDVPGAEAIAVVERIIQSLAGAPPPVRALLGQRLRAQDGVNWAPVGGGFALPHFSARVTLGREAGFIALLLLRDALPLREPPADGVPVTRLFFFVPPSPRAHLDTLGRLSKALAAGPVRSAVQPAAPDAEIYQALAAADPARGEDHRHPSEEPA